VAKGIKIDSRGISVRLQAIVKKEGEMIKERGGKVKCKHFWIRNVSDSAHWQQCLYCGLNRTWDSTSLRYINFTDGKWDVEIDEVEE